MLGFLPDQNRRHSQTTVPLFQTSRTLASALRRFDRRAGIKPNNHSLLIASSMQRYGSTRHPIRFWFFSAYLGNPVLVELAVLASLCILFYTLGTLF